MTLFSENPQVKSLIQSYEWPKGNRLTIEFVDRFLDFPTSEGHMKVMVLQLFRNNFDSFDGIDQLRIKKNIDDVIPRLNSMGIPTIFEVGEGDGRIVR